MSELSTVKQVKVLVIDDSALQSMIIKKILGSDHDYTVKKNGKEALEVIKQETFDIIFLDLLMPEFSGFQVLENLPEGQSFPIVVASADKQNSSVERCLDLGAIAFVQKPFQANEIQSIFNQVVRNKT